MKSTTLPLIACFLMLLFDINTVRGDMRHATKIRAGIPPYEVVADIIRSNQEKMPVIATISDTPIAPFITWLTDCDSRMQPDLILNNFYGRILNIQNPGGQLNLALGAVDLGVRQLFSPVLLIIGVSDSPSMQLLADAGQEISPAIDQDLAPLRQLLADDTEYNNGGKIPTSTASSMAAKNVDLQVKAALKRYSDRVVNGRLVIIGGLLDFAGEYGTGKGRLIIININGETDDDALWLHPVLAKLSPEQRLAVGRIPRSSIRQKLNQTEKE